MHWYRFSIGDYRRQTGHLTLTEHAIYRALIDTYYLDEKPLSLDTKLLMRSHNVRTQIECESFANVLHDFFVLDPNIGYRHHHIDKALEVIYSKSESARKSARIRWDRDKEKKEIQLQYEKDAIASGDNADASKIDAPDMLPSNPVTQYPVTHESARHPDSLLAESTGSFDDPIAKPLTETNGKFPMRQDWKPQPESWEANRMRSGIINNDYDQAILADFILYWEGEMGIFTESQWQGKLIQSIKRVIAKTPPQDEVDKLIEATSGKTRSNWAN